MNFGFVIGSFTSVTIGSSMNLVVVGLIHGFGLLWGKLCFGLLLICFGHARAKNNSESLCLA